MNDPKPSKGLDAFLVLCTKLETLEELGEFFDLLLTEEEKRLLSSRIIILKELLEGNRSQRDIAKIQNVSISQITRGSNALKRASSSTKKFLQENLLSWRH
jgi:TrpR family transcriptional regulator, trp operon repressor